MPGQCEASFLQITKTIIISIPLIFFAKEKIFGFRGNKRHFKTVILSNLSQTITREKIYSAFSPALQVRDTFRCYEFIIK